MANGTEETAGDVTPDTAACPNGHPWNKTMKLCPVCRLENAAYQPSGDERAKQALTRPALPKPAPIAQLPAPRGETAVRTSPEDIPLSPSANDANEPVAPVPAAASGKIDVEANLARLVNDLANFRREHGAQGHILGVFGSPESGKSFLNARLQWLMGATGGGSVQQLGYRVIRSTVASTATWSVFELKGPTGSERTIMVVDLPGEEFVRATQDNRQAVDQYKAVLAVASGLILFIAADLIDSTSKFQGGVREDLEKDMPPQKNYLNFLELAASIRQNPAHRPGTPRTSDLPVLVAISRADRILGNPPIPPSDAWIYLCSKSKLIAGELVRSFSSFCCGYVASHVGAETCVAVELASKDKRTSLANLAQPIESALRGLPLEGYFRACLVAQLARGGTVKRLPTLTELVACNLSIDDFDKASAQMARRDPEAILTMQAIESMVDIALTPIANDELASYGVRSMMERMLDLIEEPADGINRKRRSRLAPSLDPDTVQGWPRRLQANAARWVSSRIPEAGSLGDRVLRYFKLTTKAHMRRAGLAAGVLSIALATLAVYEFRASPAVDLRAKRATETIRGTGDLPVGFALDTAAVWDLSPKRLQEIRRDFVRILPTLDLRGDHLVRAPNFLLALRVNEENQPFHALLPGNTPNMRGAQELLDAIECSEVRRCVTSRPTITPPARGTDGARVLNYVAALSAYLRGGTAQDVGRYLDNFEYGRSQLAKRNELEAALSPTKQILLPVLLQDLMLAHARFRDEPDDTSNVRNTHRAYGEALSSALGNYVAQSAALHARRPGRSPNNLGQELKAIGVEPQMLAMHLVATALASTDSIDDLRNEVQKRLAPLGASQPGGAYDLEKYAARYPELLCLYHQLQVVGTGTGATRYNRACQASQAVPDNPFGAERSLVDPGFWSADRSRTRFSLTPWIPLIRDAANKAIPDERDPAALRSLRALAEIPESKPAWLVMLEPRHLVEIAALALVLFTVAWVVLQFWLLVLSLHRLVTPWRRDRQQV